MLKKNSERVMPLLSSHYGIVTAGSRLRLRKIYKALTMSSHCNRILQRNQNESLGSNETNVIFLMSPAVSTAGFLFEKGLRQPNHSFTKSIQY